MRPHSISATLQVIAALVVASASAAENHWIGVTDGAWTDAARWTGGVPTADDDVVIDAIGAAYTISLNGGSVTVNSVVISSSSATLWVHGINGTHASLTAASGFTNAGTIRLEASGGFSSNLAITSGNLLNTGSILVNFGDAGGGRSITGGVTNQGTMTVAANSALTVYNLGHTFTQNGTLTCGGGVAISSGTFLQQGGTLDATAGGLSTNGTTATFSAGVCSGTVSLTNSTLNVQDAEPLTFVTYGNSALSGDIAAGQTLWIDSGVTTASVIAANGFTNAGTIRMESSGGPYNAFLTVNNGTLTNNGTILMNKGGGGPRYLTGNVVNNGTITVASDLINAAYVQNGTYTQSAGASFDCGGGLTFQGNTSIAFNGGTLNTNGGRITCPACPVTLGGAVTLDAAAVITLSGSLFQNGGTQPCVFHFLGVYGGSWSGDLAAEQTLWIDSGVTTASVIAANGFTNAGTIRLESSGGPYYAYLTVNNGALTNNGTVLMNHGGGGPRYLTGAVTNNGHLRVDAATPAVFSNLLLNPTGTYHVQLGGPVAGMFSTISVNGPAALGGTLALEPVNGYVPTLADRFAVVSATTLAGQFATISGGDYVARYSPTVATVYLANGPCPSYLDGDLDGDGQVGLSDLAIMLANFGTTCP